MQSVESSRTRTNKHVHAPLQYWIVFSSSQAVEEEDKMTPEQLAIKNVGKQVTMKKKKSFMTRWYIGVCDWCSEIDR